MRHQGAQPPGEKARRQAAAILFSRRQGRRDDGGPLRPCQTVQAASAAVAYPAQPAGPDHPRHPPQDRRVFISGQKRGVFGVIKRELRRRSAIEPIIDT
jgi:hypothetical protein